MTKWNILVFFLVGFCSTVEANLVSLDRSNLTIRSATEQVACRYSISKNGSQKSILWQKNGKMITNDTDEPIYQQIYKVDIPLKGDRLLMANIIFVNPQSSDEGQFHCIVYNEGLTKNLTLHVTVENFVDWPQRNESATQLSHQFQLTFHARPQPNITWSANGVELEKNDDIFQHNTTYNHTTLTLTEVIIIKSLLYFGEDPTFSFSAYVNEEALSFYNFYMNGSDTYSFTLNSRLSDFDGKSFVVQLTTKSEEILRDECAVVGGYVDEEAVRGLECRIKAAEVGEDLELADDVTCDGNSLQLVIDNYVTDELASYQLIVKQRSDDVIRANNHTISSQIHTTIDQLLPRTNYVVEFSYKPKYWSKSIRIVRNFTTGGEIPVQPTVTRAHMSTNSPITCNFDLDVSNTNDTSQISQIIILQHLSFAHSALVIKQNYSSMKSTYTFQIVNDGDGDDVVFSIQLESCHGDVGLESIDYMCEKVTDQQTTIIIAASGALIFIIIVAVISIYCICRRRKMSRKMESAAVDVDEDYIDVEVTLDDAHEDNYVDLTITNRSTTLQDDEGDGNYVYLEIPGPSKETSMNIAAINDNNIQHGNTTTSPQSPHYENVDLTRNSAIANSLLRKFKKH